MPGIQDRQRGLPPYPLNVLLSFFLIQTLNFLLHIPMTSFAYSPFLELAVVPTWSTQTTQTRILQF